MGDSRDGGFPSLAASIEVVSERNRETRFMVRLVTSADCGMLRAAGSGCSCELVAAALINDVATNRTTNARKELSERG